ncbi:hypothetical protein A3I34_00275 [Candidatus Jorgensenbacteria bacterium RIFCSPLOWO2_02_FULL_45_12]|uniref:Crossover junction endodeoxyribonuclease RuvC n=1 Tax=Candidatus Jorgensenbacteria bacterium RIFCSPHIGHO2_02_FULL_45_20 TaxID=1798470 RepID=A0A1F6BNP3_9BACT|nr:MAG: hypothetical protein A3D55_03205 [Candidatus Jorgensenbacteria bacterium RIFCSPHIGHO2_02_FULL_45_20]OGG42361.1 MAG: hypothetical protein A3I34_00275 [Candidatus Jorgensenbacteria bacterium RIFCSPLOWO2_02_FULL_45_12]
MKDEIKNVSGGRATIILGIDPGVTRIGVGVVKKNSGKFSLVAAHLLIPENIIKKYNNGKKLIKIESALKKLITDKKPDIAVVEKLFFFKNKKTAFPVAYARGIIIKTLSQAGIPYAELTPTGIKLAVTGSGTATKEAVAKMVSATLHEKINAIDDATDALAAAIAAPSLFGGTGGYCR